MKKLRPSGYVCADDSLQPGYLAARFKKRLAEIKAKAEQDARNKAEAQDKTITLPRKAAR